MKYPAKFLSFFLLLCFFFLLSLLLLLLSSSLTSLLHCFLLFPRFLLLLLFFFSFFFLFFSFFSHHDCFSLSLCFPISLLLCLFASLSIDLAFSLLFSSSIFSFFSLTFLLLFSFLFLFFFFFFFPSHPPPSTLHHVLLHRDPHNQEGWPQCRLVSASPFLPLVTFSSCFPVWMFHSKYFLPLSGLLPPTPLSGILLRSQGPLLLYQGVTFLNSAESVEWRIWANSAETLFFFFFEFCRGAASYLSP